MRQRKYAAPIVAGLVAGGAVAGAALAAADYVFRRMTAPPGARRSAQFGFTPFETGVDWEDVAFPGGDGAWLRGWLLVRDARAPAVLACGGYRGRRSDLLGISSQLWRAGFTVLLFDYVGYGDEPGPVTLGYRELADARAALRFLRQLRPTAPLGAIGFSMGAAIAVMLAAREPEVGAVLADSPFTDQREIVRFHLGRRFGLRPSGRTELLAGLLLTLVDRRLARQFGFRFADVHPLRDVARLAPRPLFLIHGEEDRTIPVEHGRQMVAAARIAGVPVETWFVPGAGHCDAYFRDRHTYCARAAGFFAAHLGWPQPALPSGTLDGQVTSPLPLQPTRESRECTGERPGAEESRGARME
ncbi:MAG: alpha/beta hydrolase [Chloroflexota bacterium]